MNKLIINISMVTVTSKHDYMISPSPTLIREIHQPVTIPSIGQPLTELWKYRTVMPMRTMKGTNAISVVIKYHIKVVWEDMWRLYIMVSDTFAGNASIKQLQSQVSLNTKDQYMKESNSPAGIVARNFKFIEKGVTLPLQRSSRIMFSVVERFLYCRDFLYHYRLIDFLGA